MEEKRECAGKCGGRCGARSCFLPLAGVTVVALFAVLFGLRACTIADDPEKVMEETSYQVSAYLPGN